MGTFVIHCGRWLCCSWWKYCNPLCTNRAPLSDWLTDLFTGVHQTQQIKTLLQRKINTASDCHIPPQTLPLNRKRESNGTMLFNPFHPSTRSIWHCSGEAHTISTFQSVLHEERRIRDRGRFRHSAELMQMIAPARSRCQSGFWWTFIKRRICFSLSHAGSKPAELGRHICSKRCLFYIPSDIPASWSKDVTLCCISKISKHFSLRKRALEGKISTCRTKTLGKCAWANG